MIRIDESWLVATEPLDMRADEEYLVAGKKWFTAYSGDRRNMAQSAPTGLDFTVDHY